MTAVAHVVEKSSDQKCQMSYIIDSDNAHEDFQRLIVSTITAKHSPSPDPLNAGKRQWDRTKQIRGKSWKRSGIIIIDILDPVPASGDDVEMPDGGDHCNPLRSL
jgi:hypothetical protein